MLSSEDRSKLMKFLARVAKTMQIDGAAELPWRELEDGSVPEIDLAFKRVQPKTEDVCQYLEALILLGAGVAVRTELAETGCLVFE